MSKNATKSKPAAASANKSKYVFVPFGTFSKDRCVINDPVTTSFAKNGGTVENTGSSCTYTLENGEKGVPIFQLAPRSCFGVSANHKYLTEKIDENIDGYQICYSYTELATVSKPTEEEQYGLDLMKDLWDMTVEKGRAEASRDEPRIPAPSVNSFAGAEAMYKKNKNSFQNAVKLPYEHPNQKDSKLKDKSKPLRSYFKLVTQGTGPDCKILTPFYEPGDVKVNGKKFVDRRGIVEPCVKFDGVRWGAHMNAPHGASLKFAITEANFVPTRNDKLPTQRMLSANTAAPVDDDSDSEVEAPRKKGGKGKEEDHTGEAEDFASPEDDGDGDSADPIKALKASPATTKKPVATSKPKPKVVAKPIGKASATSTGKTSATAKSGAKPTAPTAKPKPAAAGGSTSKPKPETKKKAAPPPPPPEEDEDVEVNVDEDEEVQD